jgi:hypothetical protein
MGELVDRDQEHLRLLKIGFYLLGGTAAFASLLALLYIGIGAVIASGVIPFRPPPGQNAADPRTVGSMLLIFGAVFLLAGLVGALLTLLAAHSLGQRRRRIFCMIIAGLWCISVPFGTAIGVCALLVLNRPSVRALFEQRPAGPAEPPRPQPSFS